MKITLTIEDVAEGGVRTTCTPKAGYIKEKYQRGTYTAAEYYAASCLSTILVLNRGAAAAAAKMKERLKGIEDSGLEVIE